MRNETWYLGIMMCIDNQTNSYVFFNRPIDGTTARYGSSRYHPSCKPSSTLNEFTFILACSQILLSGNSSGSCESIRTHSAALNNESSRALLTAGFFDSTPRRPNSARAACNSKRVVPMTRASAKGNDIQSKQFDTLHLRFYTYRDKSSQTD